MERKIGISGKEYTIKANALLPRRYRAMFGKDLIIEMRNFVESYQKNESVDFSCFENLTWLMLKTAGEDVGDTPEEWLETIEDIFSIYECTPQVIELWGKSRETTSTPRKK